MLAADILMEKDMLDVKHKLITLQFRGSNQVPECYYNAALPLLNNSHLLTKLYLGKAHKGPVASFGRSWREFWIIEAGNWPKPSAKNVQSAC